MLIARSICRRLGCTGVGQLLLCAAAALACNEAAGAKAEAALEPPDVGARQGASPICKPCSAVAGVWPISGLLEELDVVSKQGDPERELATRERLRVDHRAVLSALSSISVGTP